MGFADALAAETEKVVIKGPPCSVGVTLDKMGTTDATALQAALDDPSIGHAAISRALRAEGYRVGRNAIERHRRGDCQCELRRGVR